MMDGAPPIWLPPKPAIVRPIEHKLLRPGFLPANRAERRAAIKDLIERKVITPEQAKRARVGLFVPAVGWGAGWSPTLLADLSMWVDASHVASVTLNGSNVSYWASLGGDGPGGLQQAMEGNQPPYTSGQYVSFEDFAAHRYLTPDGTWPSTYDCYFIGRTASSGASYQVLLNGASVQYQYMQQNSSNQVGGYTSGFKTFGQTWPDATEGFALCRHVSGSGIIANRNGGSLSTATVNIGGPPLSVGNDTAQPWGRLYEMIVTDAFLSTDDRQTVEGYLAWKWGLESLLPGGHPYETEPP